jgi:hypothetical protein
MSAFQIFTQPSQQALDSSARTLAGATLTFQLTGTSTPTNAYADSALATPLANPLTADSGGVFVPIFLDPTVTYRIILKNSAGSVLQTWDPANESLLTQALIGLALNPRTAAEISAGVTPVNYAYPPGDVRRYGAAIDNSTDDTTALTRAIAQAAVSGGADVMIPVVGTMLLSSPVAILANVRIRGLGEFLTTIKVKGGTGDTCNPLLYAKQVDGWSVSDFTLDGNATNLAQSFGHALLRVSGSSDWSVERVRFRDCGKTTLDPAGAHFFITAYETADPATITAFDVRNVPSKRWRVKDCHFSDPSKKSQFGLRLWSNFDYNIADSAFATFVQDGIVSGCTFEGFDWNPVELAGPGVRHNNISDCIVFNSHGFGGFEADKGASYNTFSRCIVRDATVDRIDTWGFRAQGYPLNAGGANPQRYATGNIFDACRVQNFTGTASFNVGAVWVNLAKETSVRGLHADTVKGGADESAVMRIEEADDTRIDGGTWNNVHRGLFLGVNVNRVLLSGVISDGDSRFLDITGSGTRTGISVKNCDINISTANIALNVSQMELTATGNMLRGASATAFNLVNNGSTGFIGDNRFAVATTFANTLPPGLRIHEQVFVTTTDATVAVAVGFTVADESTIQIEMKALGRKSDTSDRAFYHREAGVYRDGGGSATLVGTVQDIGTPQESNAAWQATIGVTGNDAQLNVTGVAATTIKWAVEFDAQAI